MIEVETTDRVELHARVFEDRALIFSNAARDAGLHFAVPAVDGERYKDPLGNTVTLAPDEVAVKVTAQEGQTFAGFWTNVHALAAEANQVTAPRSRQRGVTPARRVV